MADLVPFGAAVVAFAVVGVVAGMLIARRIDAWDRAQDEASDGVDQEPEP